MDMVLDSIKKRYSVRTYGLQKLESNKQKELRDFLAGNIKGPFGNEVRFKLIDVSEKAADELKKYISYGNVKGASHFIAGTVKKGTKSMEDFGYCMEKNILLATSLGLGTVWLGGSLNRSNFALEMNAAPDEVIPAITPLGYAAAKRSITDILIRTMSGGKNRKEFSQLFYDSNSSTPLEKSVSGKYTEVLEAVRLAPSASNKQPWRIIKEKGKNSYHLYMEENKTYNNAIKDINIQNNDMGIAMCHFELAALELGLEGSWQTENPGLGAGELVYIVSWIG
jgi:hypothetical protein